MTQPTIIVPKQYVEKSSDIADSDIDDEDEQCKDAPKKFLASSLAESLFNGLLQKIRHRGIPSQKGFLHVRLSSYGQGLSPNFLKLNPNEFYDQLRRITGYGSAASTNKPSNNAALPKLPLKNLVRSTIKLTRQTIQESCEKERQKKLKDYHQGGIPRYRPFIDMLDEFKHLVREAERLDQVDVSKKRTNLESGWANIMEEIRNKGLLKTINQQVEAQRMDTIYGIWFNIHNKTDRGENAAMATVHEARCVVQEELKDAVKNMRERAKSEDEALTNYYADLKDQMVDSLRRKMLALCRAKQINTEIKTRLEQEDELKDDPIRKKATTERRTLHAELKNIHALVLKEEKRKKGEMISRQEKMKETVMNDIVQKPRNKLEQIKEKLAEGTTKDPEQDTVKGVWAYVYKDGVKKCQTG